MVTAKHKRSYVLPLGEYNSVPRKQYRKTTSPWLRLYLLFASSLFRCIWQRRRRIGHLHDRRQTLYVATLFPLHHGHGLFVDEAVWIFHGLALERALVVGGGQQKISARLVSVILRLQLHVATKQTITTTLQVATRRRRSLVCRYDAPIPSAFTTMEGYQLQQERIENATLSHAYRIANVNMGH